MTQEPINLKEFFIDIEGIESTEDRHTVRLKSRDYFWYSPILNAQLKGCFGQALVRPADESQVIRVAAACARHRVPITVRGGGTGNYGQAVPLNGGIILDMTALNRVPEIGDGYVRTEAGALISTLDNQIHTTGQALQMWPSTKDQATIGGFVAGGSGGIGSIRTGMLRDDGNVRALRIVTLEEEPRIITLEGRDIQKAHHAYGTNGIIVELELALCPAIEWHHGIVLFDDYPTAMKFGGALCRADLDINLVSAVDSGFARFYPEFGDRFPEDKHGVFIMAGPNSIAQIEQIAREHGGHVSLLATEDELAALKLPPAYECGWNHTTLKALKHDRSWTYQQVAYPQPYDPAADQKIKAEFQDEVHLHHEFARERDDYQVFCLPLIKFTSAERLRFISERFEALGCTIFDAHVYTIVEGGMKTIDVQQASFKQEADPHGLMNIGKTSMEEA